MTYEINLKERGLPEVVPTSIWQDRELESPMQALASVGVIKLSWTIAGTVLTPGHFVGELRLPGVTLKIHPKSAKLLSAMEQLALTASSRRARHIDPLAESDAGEDQDPAGSFVRALFDAIREGLPWNYGTQRVTTSFPRGRLEWGPTISQLVSRGVRHRVVVNIPKRVQGARLARLVHAAHACLPTTPGATPKVLADAQALLPAFDQANPFKSLDEALAEARMLIAGACEGFSRAAMRLLACSFELLARQYDTGCVFMQIPGGIARFRDLEELWERCVQRFVENCSFIRASDTETRLHGLRGCGTKLLPDGGPELDPDVVAFQTGRVIAVFDAKYKALEARNSASSGDLYQLTAYVRSTSARLGMLIHFNDDTASAVRVGTTPEGAPIITVSMSPSVIWLKGENALDSLLALAPGVLKSCNNCFSNGVGHQRGDGIPDLASNVLLRA